MINSVKDYSFSNVSLLELALTHRSFSTDNYERLEFLGDSILDFVVGEYLFQKCKNDQEGKLSVLRSRFVSEAYLCHIFDEFNITEHVKLGKSYKSELTKAVKADILEAIIGAIYLDSNFETVKKFVIRTLKLNNYGTIKNTDYKSQMQEYYQGLSKKNRISYKLIVKEGTPHNPTFVSSVLLNKESLAVGRGPSKQEAEQAAAHLALIQAKKSNK